MSFRRLLPVAALALLAACGDDPTPPRITYDGRLYVVNAAPDVGAFEVWIDEALATRALQPRERTGTLFVKSGNRAVAFVRPTDREHPVEFNVNVASDRPRLLIGLAQGSELVELVAQDTNAIVPDGATKLRVVNATNIGAQLDVWRTQPDFAGPVRTMTAPASRAETPFIQSTPGTWSITVTAHDAGATAPGTPLATTQVAITDGGRYTIVLVNGPSAGSVQLVAVNER